MTENLTHAQTCRICGQVRSGGEPFDDWVRPTFTDWDKLQSGDIICDQCLFWFDERSVELAQRVGKEKPQRMRNYSHFVVAGEWVPLSKGNKARMRALLLSEPFPELAVIAESGQKHLAFRAPRNEPGRRCGWVQFEEQALFLDPALLTAYLEPIEQLYETFSKTEIATGRYKPYRVHAFGVERWEGLERIVRRYRDSLLFDLALFLAQKGEKNDTGTRKGGAIAMGGLAGDAAGLQEPLQAHNLAAVRERSAGGGLHEPPGQIHQLALPEVGCDAQRQRRADSEQQAGSGAA